MVRFLGVTGHTDPDLLIQCLNRFPFDQILMAVNAADRHHLSFSEKLLPLAIEKQMGIIGMKIPARGRILANWNPGAHHASSFEGQAKVLAPGNALRMVRQPKAARFGSTRAGQLPRLVGRDRTSANFADRPRACKNAGLPRRRSFLH